MSERKSLGSFVSVSVKGKRVLFSRQTYGFVVLLGVRPLLHCIGQLFRLAIDLLVRLIDITLVDEGRNSSSSTVRAARAISSPDVMAVSTEWVITPGVFSWKKLWLMMACLIIRWMVFTCIPENLDIASNEVDSPTGNDLSNLKRIIAFKLEFALHYEN